MLKSEKILGFIWMITGFFLNFAALNRKITYHKQKLQAKLKREADRISFSRLATPPKI